MWLRYSATGQDFDRKFIKPYMAEATAIFPFFVGADGLWLWEDPATYINKSDNYAIYEYFVNGLYKLSKHKDMFVGTNEFVIPTPASNYVDNHQPIWRGVVKGEEILIAAQNPYAADDNVTTTLLLNYKTWQKNISLKGREVFLCRFSLKNVNTDTTKATFGVYPNPSTEVLNLQLSTKQPWVQIRIVDSKGKTMYDETHLNNATNIFSKALNINYLSSGVYYLEAFDGQTKQVKKIVKQ